VKKIQSVPLFIFAVGVSVIAFNIMPSAAMLRTSSAQQASSSQPPTAAQTARSTNDSSSTPARLAQVKVQSAPAETATITPVESATTDTAPIVRQLASAQTRQASTVVTYPSLRIDNDKRDQLYAIATSVVIVGSSLYGMTLMRLSQRNVVASRRPLYIK